MSATFLDVDVNAANSRIVHPIYITHTAFDIIHGTLFCGGCNDIVLDATFDTVQQRERGRVASTSKGNVPGPRTSSFGMLTHHRPSPAATHAHSTRPDRQQSSHS